MEMDNSGGGSSIDSGGSTIGENKDFGTNTNEGSQTGDPTESPSNLTGDFPSPFSTTDPFLIDPQGLNANPLESILNAFGKPSGILSEETSKSPDGASVSGAENRCTAPSSDAILTTSYSGTVVSEPASFSCSLQITQQGNNTSASISCCPGVGLGEAVSVGSSVGISNSPPVSQVSGVTLSGQVSLLTPASSLNVSGPATGPASVEKSIGPGISEGLGVAFGICVGVSAPLPQMADMSGRCGQQFR